MVPEHWPGIAPCCAVVCLAVASLAAPCCAVPRRVVLCCVLVRCTPVRCGAVCCAGSCCTVFRFAVVCGGPFQLPLRRGVWSALVRLARFVVRDAGRVYVAGWWLGGAVRCGVARCIRVAGALRWVLAPVQCCPRCPVSVGAGSASTTQSPYMGQLLKTGLFSLFSALLVPFATFH